MHYTNTTLILILIGLIATSGIAQEITDNEEETDSIGKQVLPRDSFPVLNNPKFVDISRAEKKKYVSDNDAVIGIVIDDVAKVYPIKTMGIHELANDTIAGIPIAVTW